MKKIAIIVAIFLSACVNNTSDVPNVTTSTATWGIIKSPNTGKCYEIARTRAWSGYDTATIIIGEIDCR